MPWQVFRCFAVHIPAKSAACANRAGKARSWGSTSSSGRHLQWHLNQCVKRIYFCEAGPLIALLLLAAGSGLHLFGDRTTPRGCLAKKLQPWNLKNQGQKWGVNGELGGPKHTADPQWDMDWFAPGIPKQGQICSQVGDCRVFSLSSKDSDVAELGHMPARRCFPSPLFHRPSSSWAKDSPTTTHPEA